MHYAANYRQYCHVCGQVSSSMSVFFFVRTHFVLETCKLRACLVIGHLYQIHLCARNTQQPHTGSAEATTISLDAGTEHGMVASSKCVGECVVDVCFGQLLQCSFSFCRSLFIPLIICHQTLRLPANACNNLFFTIVKQLLR